MTTCLPSFDSSECSCRKRTFKRNRRCGVWPLGRAAAIVAFIRLPRITKVLLAGAVVPVLLAGNLLALPPRSGGEHSGPAQQRRVASLERSESGPSLEAPGGPAEAVLEEAADGDSCAICNGVRRCDEIFVLSTRCIGCTCDPEVLKSGIECRQFASSPSGRGSTWRHRELMALLAENDPSTATVIYVHGNKVAPQMATCRGLQVYRRMIRCSADGKPIRFIIFSWPSTEIDGLIKDARVKAARTRPAGCQLAWLIDQMPGDIPIGLIGYSYGPRIVTGALHILGGGTLHGLGLSERAHPDRAPMRVVFTAAAVHAHWLGPGQYHGLAMTQVDKMLLINNCRDRAMRFYGLSTPHGSPQALGLSGPTCIGPERTKIHCLDVSRWEGPSHDERRYLGVPGTACRLWNYAAWE